MKVINKILCFLLVFVLCVPLLCFNVSAGSGVGNVLKDTVLDNKLPFTQSDMQSYLSKSENSALASSIKYKNADGSALIGYNSGFNYHPYTDTFYYYPFDQIYNSTYLFKAYTLEQTLIDADNLYYVAFSYYPDKKNFQQIILYSTSEIYLKDYGSYISYSSDSDLYYSVYQTSIDTNSYSYFVPYGVSYASGTVLNCLDFKTKPPIQYSNTSSDLKSFSFRNDNQSSTQQLSMMSVYCNFNLDTSLLPNVTPQKFDKLSVNGQAPSFSDYIDVKLTPEFTIGMDRSIPDSTFGISEDYWSLEVTNNNDFNIQFKCYVIPATGAVNYVSEWSKSDGLKSVAEGLPVLVNTDDFVPVVPDETVWMLEKDQWIYSKETENQDDYFKDTPYLVNKPTSCFFVQAGGTFKQVIKWNQLNLNKNQPYQILVTACECPYDRASDIHISLASDDYSQSFKHIIEESYFIVYDDKFSVKNPLYYDSTDTFGGVIANTGSNQVNNDYWKLNAIEKDGEIEIRNADYSNGWRLNPDGGADSGTLKEGLFNNLDDISFSDVTKLVQDTGNYLILVSTVFKHFPSWVWILLFAGISGLIVMGVFKMLH